MIPSTKPPKAYEDAPPPLCGRGGRESSTIGPPPKIENSPRSISIYGELQALHNVNMTLADRSITAFIGPVRLRESRPLLRVLNRMYALYPKQARGRGRVLLIGGQKDILGPVVDASPSWRVTASAWVFQKTDPRFPCRCSTMSLSACGWAGGMCAPAENEAPGGGPRCAMRRFWDEGQGTSWLPTAGACRAGKQQRLCIAPAPSPCGPEGPAARRTDRRARSYFDAAGRGDACRRLARRKYCIVVGDAIILQQAGAGGPNRHGLHVSGGNLSRSVPPARSSRRPRIARPTTTSPGVVLDRTFKAWAWKQIPVRNPAAGAAPGPSVSPPPRRLHPPPRPTAAEGPAAAGAPAVRDSISRPPS